ncbi:2-C-methyl-D-erythritol 4-phosphate cytidylyltransferase/2-C-methyl-D-erythritol 2,4-cyclodiphosphate synthase [Parvibaculum indicum]|uniref:bifunctional 2-C-methyl-D-erythritol 4-phosphate cytidylyltransferase/2-C-methyl-D-erythritol 2,4-cyclodiphosphate synthase n=1 Tax=Parvibaculum indicum TaxID=562969 RepID=UPI001962B997|nr:bifunctional 2-C-methyl-D-erythritol 4-phosphate cytidylyltransferase/2-C-methyl-D-erythritol 2,4-cyclodiphosphate synthase [Parvibaculum indicum]NIJ42764.1 2-C-methyl-D-erythritol 4-phosphate cytidylyltransferase/2-C-methyl-D-erythritol 2,4-cyclodiphosphate synthase [Parvibaculum indicum]
MKIVALIVAAGRGSRAGPGAPKQFRDLGGEPVLRHTLRRFAGHPGVEAVLTVIHPDDRDAFEEAAAGLSGLLPPVTGGDTRQASVLRGLEALESEAPDAVLIHDGARPFVSARLIDDTIEALQTHRGAMPGLPVADTLRRSHDGLAGDAVPRDGLWRAQTPQAFHYPSILAAHRAARDGGNASYTDDVAVAAAAGIDVAVVPGDEDNFKITSAEDLMRASSTIAGTGEYRTGQGFDVHRFGPGDHVMLCGVKVAHSQGLLGHSDADAGLHAITDAILGAIAQGDIGRHFPPSDPQWKGASSDLFLAHAARLADEAGATVTHVDLTLICEKPKIGPHADAMRERISDILRIGPERVSVKATTTEGLGFTGRGEGIAAQAVATLRFR